MGKSWFKNAVIYQIFLDRFSRGKTHDSDPLPDATKPEFCGGNLQGVIDRLDHVEHLGANAIWISPLNSCSAYHGYHITDFFGVDPRFGDMSDVATLVKEAHERGIKILMDFVPNHVSSKHPYFLNAQSSEESPFRDWFSFKKWPDDYVCFLHFKELPKLNLENSAARKHIIDAAHHWLSLGIDGFRLDHVSGPSDDFWRSFVDAVSREFPNAVTIGEAWMKGVGFQDVGTLRVGNRWRSWLLGSETLMRHYRDTFDGVLDFEFNRLVNLFGRGKLDQPTLDKKLKRHYEKFPGVILPSFLDNHDMDRFLFTAGNDKEQLRRAVEIQFSLPQPVIIYYGTEIGMSQEKSMYSVPSHGDLFARQMMIWDETGWDRELFDFYRDLVVKKRQASSA